MNFVPPHLRALERELLDAQRAEARQPLVFEAAVNRFLAEHGKEYANPAAAKSAFRGLGTAFLGLHLDTVTKVDIRQYFLDRVQNTGPFELWPRRVSIRVPEVEIAYLSALYTALQDEGHAIENPCHRPRTRRKDSPLAPYRRKRAPCVASKELLGAIFNVSPGSDGVGVIRPAHRALFKLTYYTAARPESEPCRLRHEDVTFGKKGEWGTVRYRDTKNDKSERELPLHPEAEDALKTIMLPEPIDRAARTAWAREPIFRMRRRRDLEVTKPWDRNSYRKAWWTVRRALVEQHPEIDNLVLRDLRTTAKTVMIDEGHPELTVDKILGHADSVRSGYYRANLRKMREALDALTLAEPAAVPAAGQGGHTSKRSIRAIAPTA